MAEIPVWFITGCSTGFGRELAKLVLAKGWRVIATARNRQSVEDLAAGSGGRVLPLALDVDDPKQIASAVKEAEAKFGRVDVLVNNAGYGFMSAVEEADDDELRAQFETNFFGLAAMTRAVLPIMRRQRSGHIINVSSMAGMCGFPGVAYYNASKFAVEGLSEALAKEVGPLGIKVTIVEPGPFRTDWAGRSLKMTRNDIPDYAETAGARRKAIANGSGKQAGDPVRGAQAMLDLVASPKPPMRLVLGRIALSTIRAKLDQVRGDLDTWEQTSVGADYPETQAAK